MIFRVALVLIRMCLGSQESLKSSPGLYETLEKLRHIPGDIDESIVVREVSWVVKGTRDSQNIGPVKQN